VEQFTNLGRRRKTKNFGGKGGGKVFLLSRRSDDRLAIPQRKPQETAGRIGEGKSHEGAQIETLTNWQSFNEQEGGSQRLGGPQTVDRGNDVSECI